MRDSFASGDFRRRGPFESRPSASVARLGKDMSRSNRKNGILQSVGILCLAFVGLIAAVPQLCAADNDDFDAYKIKITGFWFYTQPTGTFTGTGGRGFFDFSKDVGFNSYSTYTLNVDWKLTRKNHLLFSVTPFDRTRSFVAGRTINFQGQTFNAGLSVNANLSVNGYAPGYQYDIIRRKRGHLGIRAQLDLFDVNGSLDAAAQVSNGLPVVAHRAQGSLRAPLPVFGPDVRFYLTKNSNRLFVTGDLFGMYFFGYGNFLSTVDTLGITATKHLNIRAGYQLGTRLNVNNNANTRIGISLTQKGPVVGIEVPF